MLTSNYFQFETKTDWCLYQYRVDFSPEEDRTPVKKALLYIQRKVIAVPYIFDGSMMFTSHRLSPDVSIVMCRVQIVHRVRFN